MPIPLNDFRQFPEYLMGTRWVYFTTEEIGRMEGIGHVVQVIDLRDGRAHMVTLYSEPFQHWWVPLESILTEFSAFTYLGLEEELTWMGIDEWVTNTHPFISPNTRIRFIQRFDGHRVEFGDGTAETVLALADHYRLATIEELRADAGTPAMSDDLAEAPVVDFDPHFDTEEPEKDESDTLSRRTFFEQLLEDED